MPVVPGAPGAPVIPGQPAPASEPISPDQESQLSFQGANIDMIVQWLAKTSGKSIIKHPRVQCQLTIVNSRKLPMREAMRMVYNALSLEGFTTIESEGSILIVPEGQEPKLSPMFVDDATELPVGRQRIVKVFKVEHIPVAELRDRVKQVLSEKATVEVDERGNQIIVTDYTDNIQLLTSLLPELDKSSASESVVNIYPLKFLQAQELANLLNLVLSNQPGPTSSGRARTPTPSARPPGMPPGMSSMPQPSPTPGGSAPPSATPAGEVRFWPDNTSNRLIVSAPKDRVAEVEALIESLDTEKPADVAVRVLPLRHVSATDLVREIAPLYQRMSGDSLKDVIEVTANERSNSLIVLSSESNFRMLRAFISGIDNEDAQERVIQTFALKNADAEDVATQLRELNQSQSSGSRFVYYYTPFSNTQRKETKVVSDRRRNTVIVQAVPAEMPGIAKMIEALDEPVGDEALAPRIFPLKYVNATDIKDVLDELFLKKQQQRNYWDYVYSYEMGQGSQQEDAGRLFGKVRITSEPYSNAIIVSANSTESLAAVEGILKQLDVPSQAGESTLRVQLKFADSTTVANSLNILFARGGSPPIRPNAPQGQQPNQQNQQQPQGFGQTGFQLEREQQEEAYFPWLGGQQDTPGADGRTTRPASDLVGRVRVVPDKRSNSLLLTANMHYFTQVLKLINELDAPTAQVLIEAKILEVATDFRDRFGVRWSPDGSQAFDADDLDGSLQPSAAATFQRIFAGTGMPGALKTGVLDAGVNLDVLVQFLRKNTDATVLAEPQINVSDNELGKLFVGAQVPFISSSLNTDVGGRNDSFQYKDVGIILEVTPQINNDEDVALKIRAESSNIRSGETLFGGAILDTRNFRTDIQVKDGQSVILGGIIQKQNGEVIRKVPLLGDIPILGWAFKKKDKTVRDVELMVFLRPQITRSPADAARLLEEIDRKTPKLRQSRADMKAQAEEEAGE
jgi:type II secretion system protein D